ncbi:MAG: tetratricopeptide repeat protein, partial [Henriciella sp.]
AMAYGLSSAVYSQFGQFDEALENARAAQRIDDTHERRLVVADALANAGETDAGLLILRTEALNRPNDPYMLNTLGYYLILHTDRLEEAFQVLARASLLAPNDPYISDSFGWVRYKMGDLEGALRYIEHSRSILAPQRNWEVEDHIGDIYWHLGRRDEARLAWTNALEEYPPKEQQALIAEKLSEGLSGPPPAVIPLPNLSLSRDGQVDRQDI